MIDASKSGQDFTIIMNQQAVNFMFRVTEINLSEHSTSGFLEKMKPLQ